MKLSLFLPIACGFPALMMAIGQTPAPPQERPKTIIQTPFGPKEVDQPPAATPVSPVPAPPPVPQSTPTQPPVTVQSPATSAPPATAGGDQASPVSLSFFNEDIHAVIKIIAGALNLNYVVDPLVKGTVDISTSASLRRSDLLPLLETILKINGATMVREGNLYQIVPASSAVHEPLQVREHVPQSDPDDEMVMEIVRMKYVSATEMDRMLLPYLSEGGNIVVQDAGNVLLITDRQSNLRKLLDIINIFDSNEFEGDRVRILPVKNGQAKDVADDLRTVVAGYAFSDKSTTVRFLPLDRLNSILVVASNADIFPEIEKWMDRLDKSPSAGGGTKTFVYKVRNTRASEIQKVLAALYGQATQVSNQTPRPPATTDQIASNVAGMTAQNGTVGQVQPGSVPSNSQPAQSATQAAPPSTVIAGRNIRIITDESNNALVILALPQDYAEIEKTIQQLDILPRQVLIDAQIYQVTLSDDLSFGVTAALQANGTLANPQTTASFTSTGGLAAQSFTYIGRTRELVGFLNASDNRTRVRTLSAPSVLVSDNSPASFEVGTQIPVATSSSTTPVQSGGSSLFAQTIQMVDTGVILHVKPQINDSGNVTLEITQEVSNAEANTTSGIVSPAIGISSVTSVVVVQDGQTIAIGGFIRENQELDRNRIPLIGRIPGVGALFGNTTQNKDRTELIILITPHVLRTHVDADAATDELKAKLKELKVPQN